MTSLISLPPDNRIVDAYGVPFGRCEIDEEDPFVEAQKFFKEICEQQQADKDAARYEKRANDLPGLLDGERFALRYVEKNFDGEDLGKWCVFFRNADGPALDVQGRWTFLTHTDGGLGELMFGGMRLYIQFRRGGVQAVKKAISDSKKRARKTRDILNEAKVSRSIEILARMVSPRKIISVPRYATHRSATHHQPVSDAVGQTWR